MKKWIAALITVAMFGFYGSAIAVPIVDQEYDPTGEADFLSYIGATHRAQVFTVGLSGQLTGVDLLISRVSSAQARDLIVDIRTTTNGIPINDDFNTLAHVQIVSTDIPTIIDFYHVDLTDFNIQILEGESLAVTLRTSPPTTDTTYNWKTSTDISYLGGAAYIRNPGIGWDTWFTQIGMGDSGFRTYVNDPTASDSDNDGFIDGEDNCPAQWNPDQADCDSDETGDACDPDAVDPDGDGVCTDEDNCPNVANPNQEDVDNDGIGDVCNNTTIYGTVSGDVQEGVNVEIYKVTCGVTTPIAELTTDSDGNYSSLSLENGSYLVSASKGGYSIRPNSHDLLQIPQTVPQSYDFIATEIPIFADNGDGTVTDTSTGLVWLKNANCYDSLDWPTARSLTGALKNGWCELSDGSAAGDWRLPDIEELIDLGGGDKENLEDIENSEYLNGPGHFIINNWTVPGAPFINVQKQYYPRNDNVSYHYENGRVGLILQAYYSITWHPHVCIYFYSEYNSGAYAWPVREGNDSDVDGVQDNADNCPNDPNPIQIDCDSDGQGDICDPDTVDSDRDGIDDACDDCPAIPNPSQKDADNDGIGDVCDDCLDGDDDGVCDDVDNCIGTLNPVQNDGDTDGIGDVCDSCPDDSLNDIDGDGLCGDVDNCPDVANPGQVDSDSDGIGDACDPDHPCSSVDRFVDNGDGTVKDCRTDLIWLQDALCYGPQDWFTAMPFAAGLKDGECGLTDGSIEGDWHMPSKDELQEIGTDPPSTWLEHYPRVPWTMPVTPFGSMNPEEWYWTSSPMSGPPFRYVVRMGDGYTGYGNEFNDYYVLPVRDPNN